MVLEFHRGVTAVVGPNGCGKSNVLDAIRWVLGEQSAKALRGGEMADVIFSGTDSRPALGMAEVSMSFAECEKELGVEWNEVRITRRVFRDGKSEYLINKTPCRLRDIHELFMDTGIGRSAYSIMEQGKIDQILSSKPDDRRAIFEEAAGITKYKAQKREALRKLDHTESNLVRISDIIREVKRQIGSLQRQAGKARRYQSISDSLKIFDTHLTHKNYTAFSSEMAGIHASLRSMEEERVQLEDEISSKEGESISYRVQLGSLDAQIGELKDRCQQVQNQIFSAENKIESHGQRVEETQDLIDRNESDIAAAEVKMREQETRIEETNAMIEELLATLRSGEESLQSREHSVLEIRRLRSDAERSLSELSENASRIEAQIGHFRAEKSTSLGRREAAESRLAALHADSSQSAENIASAENRLAEACAKIAHLEESAASASARISSCSETLALAKSAHAEATEEHRNTERKHAEIQSKLEVLQDLEAKGEGLGEGTQALLKGLDNPEVFLPATAGAIAALVDIDPQYIPALEAALDKDLQAVLFKDSSVAEAAAENLANGDYGRAHILPREWIASPSPSPSSFSPLPEGALAWASHCVRGSEEIRALLGRHLDQVVIAGDLATAFRLHAANPFLDYVTLAGEFVSRHGIVSAGKLGGGTASAILRKREISVLRQEWETISAQLSAFSQKTAELAQETEYAEAELAEAKQLLQSLQVDLSAAKGERGLLERHLSDARLRHDQVLRELDTLQASLDETSQKISAYETQLEALQHDLDASKSQRGTNESELAALRERESEETDALNQLRLRVATERQQRENLQSQREPMNARLAELAELMAQRSLDIDAYRARIASLELEVALLQEKIAEWKDTLTRLQNEGAALLAERSELVATIDALESAIRSARKRLSEIQEKHGKAEIRSTQLDLRMQNLQEHAHRRYQLNIEDFSPDPYGLAKALKEYKVPVLESSPSPALPQETSDDFSDDSFASPPPASDRSGIPWEEVETIVAELTEKLDSMGPVNLEAIQEFEELEERYKFLEQQNTDLTNSKQELLEVIARINQTTKEMFSETFLKIRENFQEMFTELFGGGKANLVLVDESDPLESGIEIIAKPPGKQLQSVTLLSGGERTMTAVSLLFAIYMVKPSPFCVLDEMDAPLDESNISRFIKILDRFIGQSQFVVITHNKRTISRADMLYGVTMEEHGVSKLVGVQFRGKNETSSPSGTQAPSVAESFGKSGNLASESIT